MDGGRRADKDPREREALPEAENRTIPPDVKGDKSLMNIILLLFSFQVPTKINVIVIVCREIVSSGCLSGTA